MSQENQKELHTLEDCLLHCMIGGNSIASNIIGILGDPCKFKDHIEASDALYKAFPPKRAYEIYEQWLCWKSIMEARDAAEKILGHELEHSSKEQNHEALQFISNVIELKPDKKYLLVFKGNIPIASLNRVLDHLRSRGINGVGVALYGEDELQVIEVPDGGLTS
jgi:hypothetical protein